MGVERPYSWQDTRSLGALRLPTERQGNVIVTTVNAALAWARGLSLWPVTFGLACCAIEMMATGAARYDIDRVGSGVFRPSPRQADLMIVSGTVNFKMAAAVRRLYLQMPNPKWVIAMGACAVSGGPFPNYAVVQGVDRIIPVDIYIPGCPPTPEALLNGMQLLRRKLAGAKVES